MSDARGSRISGKHSFVLMAFGADDFGTGATDHGQAPRMQSVTACLSLLRMHHRRLPFLLQEPHDDGGDRLGAGHQEQVAIVDHVQLGAVAERMKLWAFIAFAVVMTGFIYPVQGYWKWGSGFLNEMGFLDFAGSGVVHMAGAAAALAGVLLLGARKGKYGPNGQINAFPGANLPLATLGAFILWMGWFGFNGGSQLKMSTIEDANAVAQVFTNTNLAAAGGLVAALITARLLFGKSDLTMVLNGALAGLVAITAEPLTPSALQAVLIGGVGGVLVVFSILALDKLKLDDPVGAISVHGVSGIWGVLVVPLTNSDASFVTQLIGVVAIFSWVFIASLIVWGLIKVVMGLRVSEEEEYEGVDIAECGMEAYPEFTNK